MTWRQSVVSEPRFARLWSLYSRPKVLRTTSCSILVCENREVVKIQVIEALRQRTSPWRSGRAESNKRLY